MNARQVLELVEASRIVAIMRGEFEGAELEIVGALTDAGVHAVEVTMNSPGAVRMIENIATRFGSRFAVGAGTVLHPHEVEAVAGSGASFVVSPNRDLSVIGKTRQLGLASFPGCFTPSEIVEALAAGADAVKLFPARMISPEVVRDLRGPLGDARMIPTGSIDVERGRAFLDAGAWALGIGSALVERSVMEPGGIERLAARARAFVSGLGGV